MIPLPARRFSSRCFAFVFVTALVSATLLSGSRAAARRPQQQIVWNDQEKPIVDKLGILRSLSHDERRGTTKELALQIRSLPAGAHKVQLATGLAGLSTEGDYGRDTLQQVTTTLSRALREYPLPATPEGPPQEYVELAQLVRYERMQGALDDDPQYVAAMAKVDADRHKAQQANFTLTDLQGKSWTLNALRGKVVLVNFWATWCPPCRSEMPDLDALYGQFKDQGFVILAISDEDEAKVRKYIDENHYSYTILLDPGRKVNTEYNVEGIPKSFVYDREGKLVAQSIDMRTKGQFLEMLAQAGLK